MTRPFTLDPGPLAHVEHHVSGGRSTLVFVRRLGHPPGKVWAALTEPAELRGWAPYDTDRPLTSTGPATLRMIDGETVEEYPIEVRRAVDGKLLEHTWGDDLLVWELEPEDAGTRLTLRHTVESPDWLPRVAAGWHLCLVVAERRLDGEEIGPIVGAQAKEHGWDAVRDAYAAELGLAVTE